MNMLLVLVCSAGILTSSTTGRGKWRRAPPGGRKHGEGGVECHGVVVVACASDTSGLALRIGTVSALLDLVQKKARLSPCGIP